VHLALVGSWPS